MSETRFARLITMKVKRGKVGEFLETFEEEVTPMAAKLAGLRRLYLFKEVNASDKFIALSLWNNKEDAQRYAKESKKEVDIKLAKLLASKERVRQFSVLLSVVGESAKVGS